MKCVFADTKTTKKNNKFLPEQTDNKQKQKKKTQIHTYKRLDKSKSICQEGQASNDTQFSRGWHRLALLN